MILIDAHVHIHDCFDLDVMFNAACANFRQAAQSRRGVAAAANFLLLTEGAGQHRFRRLRDRKNPCRDWLVLPTLESISLRLRHKELPGMEMFLAAGRQIVTSEKLEVLALMSGEEYEEGRPLARTVAEVRENGALPALPWGAGKWLGRRKRVLCRFLEEETATAALFLADNRCRPRIWPFPEFARKSSLKILAGSDPLPFRWEERQAGSFGSILSSDARQISQDYPAAALKRLLLEPESAPRGYGHPEQTFGFFKNQTAIQLRKHFSG